MQKNVGSKRSKRVTLACRYGTFVWCYPVLPVFAPCSVAFLGVMQGPVDTAIRLVEQQQMQQDWHRRHAASCTVMDVLTPSRKRKRGDKLSFLPPQAAP